MGGCGGGAAGGLGFGSATARVWLGFGCLGIFESGLAHWVLGLGPLSVVLCHGPSPFGTCFIQYFIGCSMYPLLSFYKISLWPIKKNLKV